MFWFFRLRIALFGVSILLASVGAFVATIKKQSGGVETMATVVSRMETCTATLRIGGTSIQTEQQIDCDAARNRASRGNTQIAVDRHNELKLRYEDRTGKLHWVTADASIAPADVEVGEQVAVYYDPANPEELQKSNGVGSLVGIIFMVVFGIGIVSLALKFNPLRLIASAGGAGVRITGAGRGGEGRVKWAESADEAISRALQPEPPPQPQAAPASVYAGAPGRSFGRRAG